MNRLATLAAALLIASVCHGQTLLSLDDCVRLALDNNSSLTAQRLEQRRAEADRRHYRANFFPTIELGGKGLMMTGSGSLATPAVQLPVFLGTAPASPAGFAYVPEMSIDYNVHSLWHAGVSLTQPIYMGGRIKAAYDAAGLGIEAAAMKTRQAEADVVLDATKAYIASIKCLRLDRVARSYTSLIKTVRKNVEAACRVGMATRNDLLRVDVSLGECELLETRAANARELSRMAVCHAAGLPLDTPVEPLDTIAPTVTLADIDAVRDDISRRPEYRLLEINSLANGQKIKVARSSLLPEVAIALDYGISHGAELAGTRLFDKRWGLSGVLSVKIPIYDFGGNSASVAAARAELETSEARKADLTDKMRLEAARDRLAAVEAVTEVSIARRNLEQTVENLRVCDRAFLAGSASLTDLLEAGLLWLRAEQRLVEAECDAYVALMVYGKSCGEWAGMNF